MPLPKIVALVMVVSVMLGAGMQVDWDRMAQTLRNYGLLAKALLANFILVPGVAVLLVRSFHVQPDVATGIVLMSMAPGVPFLVNAAGRSKGGSHSFALTITVFFAALSVLTIPLSLGLVLPDVAAKIPVAKFLTTLVAFQLIPLVVGAILAPRLAAATAEKIVKVLHLIFVAAALLFLVLVVSKIAEFVGSVYGAGQLLIIAAIAVFSLGIGWLLGGPDPQYRRTLSIATDLKNIGLCALIGSEPAFAGTLVIPAVVTYFVITFALSIPVRVFFTRTKDKA